MQNIQIYAEIEKIENEIKKLKNEIQKKENGHSKCLVSLRGMAKQLVSDKELDYSIKRAQKSLFKGI